MAEAQPQLPFCRLPWHSACLSPYGGIGVCCLIPGNLGDVPNGQTLSSAWVGPTMRAFREEQRQHRVPTKCSECKVKHDLGIDSRKDQLNDLFSKNPHDPEFYKGEPSWEHIYHLDLSLSNKCNLKCLFCYSGNSVSWFKDRDELVKQDEAFFADPLGMTQNVFDSDPAELIPFIGKLTRLQEIEIKGGEPFLSASHRPLLEKLIENGRASELKLMYTSNGTVFDPTILELWKHFREVAFSVSVDGLGSVYKYVRGGRYSFETDVLPSIRQIAEHPEIQLNIHYTTCTYNLLNLPRFVEWLEHSGIATTLSLGLCEFPAYLSLTVLPIELRQQVVQELERFQHRGEIRDFSAGLLNRDESQAEKLRKEFYYYTQSVDRVRKRRMLDFVPELTSFYQTLEPGKTLC